MDISMQGFDDYVKKISQSPDKLVEKIYQQAMRDAETLAGKQREDCPVLFGSLRESIHSFCTRQGDVIEAGSRTNNDHAVYVEFGTGPVGDIKGHPLDSELGVARKSEPWLVNIPGIGIRYTHGQPAQPFMYPAMQAMKPQIEKNYGGMVMEVMK